jgi:hypothetical protein
MPLKRAIAASTTGVGITAAPASCNLVPGLTW